MHDLIFLIYLQFIIGCIAGSFLAFRTLRKNVPKVQIVVEFIFLFIYLVSILSFYFGWSVNGKNYTQPIDPIDEGYTLFAYKHTVWIILFFLLSLTAQLFIWLKGRRLPPILFVCAMSVMGIGVCISIPVLMQIVNAEENGTTSNFALRLLPINYIAITMVLVIRVLRQRFTASKEIVYSNKTLNKLNTLLANVYMQPIWIVVLMFPIFVIIMCILTLFGQDPHAFTKVFTDTSTWAFSQKEHPPYLDHNGHYLCTVAACGDPALVKPLHVGQRHGNKIIVNRQLQIANAFEELVQENLPSLHRIIRRLYDKHGYPLSPKITKPVYANLTYRLMKPLEYFFLFVLYCGCIRPEERIKRQYA